MKPLTIKQVEAENRRFPLHGGSGSDAVHSGAEYAFAVTRLQTGSAEEGCGITLTLGSGNRIVCDVIEQLCSALLGREIEELMSEFGVVSRRLADDPALRWLGPHKGVVHLALSSLVNACFDLWAKARGVPLWRLLLDLEPEQVLATARPQLRGGRPEQRRGTRDPSPLPAYASGTGGHSPRWLSRL